MDDGAPKDQAASANEHSPSGDGSSGEDRANAPDAETVEEAITPIADGAASGETTDATQTISVSDEQPTPASADSITSPEPVGPAVDGKDRDEDEQATENATTPEDASDAANGTTAAKEIGAGKTARQRYDELGKRAVEDIARQTEDQVKKQELRRFEEFERRSVSLLRVDEQTLHKVGALFVKPSAYHDLQRSLDESRDHRIFIITGYPLHNSWVRRPHAIQIATVDV